MSDAWSNWSESESCEPAKLHFARSADDVSAVVADAAARGLPVRVAGSGHSHYRLVPTDGVVLDLSGLSGVIHTDAAAQRARVWAGTKIFALGRPLHDAGLALTNQGDIDRQALAGAIGTGTHGTGQALTNLSSMVAGLTIVNAEGEQVRCSAEENTELFRAARLGLGAFGVITEIEMAVEPAFRLAERQWQASYDELRPLIDELSSDHRHFEFFWFPHNDVAYPKCTDITDEPAEYPVAGEGKRRNWSYEVLPNHRPHLHTEMEYSIPVEQSLKCLDEIRSLMRTDFPEVQWPVEYRPSQSTKASACRRSRFSERVSKCSFATAGGRTGARFTTSTEPSLSRSHQDGPNGGSNETLRIREECSSTTGFGAGALELDGRSDLDLAGRAPEDVGTGQLVWSTKGEAA